MTAPVIDGEQAVAMLRSADAVRARAGQLLERARAGHSSWFGVDDDALQGAADTVADVTRRRYPDLAIPYHSRWRHFDAGDVDRTAELRQRLSSLDLAGQARATIDLTVVSVLVDAGAGPGWTYHEAATGRSFARSEGLGVASWHAFCDGLFSTDSEQPLRVDAAALSALDTDRIAEAFQVDAANPLVGVDGRVAVLRRLGDALAAQPEVFGADGRPGGLYDALAAGGRDVTAADILALVLRSMQRIWPAANVIGPHALGDCWRHSAVRGPAPTDGWMPFHKLSQWLTYSLLEPFEWAGVRVSGLDSLTGLPEYRNGGLLLDTGVLRLRDSVAAHRPWSVGDELVVEWRALTVALLDELAPLVRARLGVDSARMPLACVLEGGTWAAGRESAQRLRGGLPPLEVVSDGTVF